MYTWLKENAKGLMQFILLVFLVTLFIITIGSNVLDERKSGTIENIFWDYKDWCEIFGVI